MSFDLLKERRAQVVRNNRDRAVALDCNKASAAGSVSQRACTFCGSRVCALSIADALHLVHGPVGCAAYTWTSAALCLGARASSHQLLD